MVARLRSRDIKLLETLVRFGVLSTAQIGTNVFEGIAHTTVMRRLRILERVSLIQRREGLQNAMSAWCLSKKGAQLVGMESPFQYRNRNAILHEVTLSEVRLRLERLGLAKDWTSETELRRAYKFRSSTMKQESFVPDGLFVHDVSGTPKVIAMELELTAKGHARYQKLFHHYRFNNAIHYIWYIVGNEATGKTIHKCWQKTATFKSGPKLIVSLLDDVLESKNVPEALTQTPAHKTAQCVSTSTENLLKNMNELIA